MRKLQLVLFLFLITSCAETEDWRAGETVYGFHLGADWAEVSNQINTLIVSNNAVVQQWIGKTLYTDDIALTRFNDSELSFIRVGLPEDTNHVKRISLYFADSKLLTNQFLVRMQVDLKDMPDIAQLSNRLGAYQTNQNSQAESLRYVWQRENSQIDITLNYSEKNNMARGIELIYDYQDLRDYLKEIEITYNND